MNGSKDFWEDTQFDLFVFFFWMGVCGCVFLGLCLVVPKQAGIVLFLFAVLLLAPVIVHGNLLAIWHWKSRYRGRHSKLWGALFIIETSGWFKLIYFLRHVLPDRRRKGRYTQVMPSEL